MSTPSSPKKLSKKQSLSILSSSALNQINNTNQEYIKPVKDRVISESTGLIKFSLKKAEAENIDKVPEDTEKITRINENTEKPFIDIDIDTNDEKENNTSHATHRLPIYVPINKDATETTNQDDQELLFKMAAKQRIILDLTEKLKQAKEDLSELEKQYKDSAVSNIPTNITSNTENKPHDAINTEINVMPVQNSVNNVAFSLKKSASLMNISNSKINAQEQFTKTQKQVTDTFNQFTTNFSNNNFFLKSKTFLESNLSKNIQMGSGLLNSIFERESDDEIEGNSDTEEVSINETQNFDYSVDFDLDRLNKINFDKKLKGTILEDLKEVDYDEEVKDTSIHNTSNKLVKILTNSSDLSEDDYGGHATVIE